jgi:hypothetical protein
MIRQLPARTVMELSEELSMRFFGSPRQPEPPAQFKERTFSMPCSRAEALQVISSSEATRGDLPFKVLGSGPANGPPLTAAIYVESMDADGFVLAAGNRVETFWRMRMALAGDNPTRGTFGMVDLNKDQWSGNTLSAVFALQRAVESVGGKTEKWPMP